MKKSFDVFTNKDLFNQIILKLEEKYKLASFTSMEWKPLNTIEVDDEESARGLIKLLEKLEDLDDVQNVSANFNISDSLMEKFLENKELILGVDPGLNFIGWGIVESLSNKEKHISHGVIKNKKHYV